MCLIKIHSYWFTYLFIVNSHPRLFFPLIFRANVCVWRGGGRRGTLWRGETPKWEKHTNWLPLACTTTRDQRLNLSSWYLPLTRNEICNPLVYGPMLYPLRTLARARSIDVFLAKESLKRFEQDRLEFEVSHSGGQWGEWIGKGRDPRQGGQLEIIPRDEAKDD